MNTDRDPSLDGLLPLDGERFVIDPTGDHWVKFEVKQIVASPDRPHGLRYSLTLHGRSGERLVGFDNAHPAPRARKHATFDHRHRLRTVRPYDYRDAASLLSDFWAEVEAVLSEKGIKL